MPVSTRSSNIFLTSNSESRALFMPGSTGMIEGEGGLDRDAKSKVHYCSGLSMSQTQTHVLRMEGRHS